MQATYTGPGRVAATFAMLASFCAVVLMGTVLAYWTWVWLAPAPESRAAAPAQAAGAAASGRLPTAGASALFGNAQGGSAGSGQSGTLKLLGVVAASGGLAAYAVIRTAGGHSVAVRAGEDVGPGLRLAEVRADGVVLTRNAVRETLALPQPGPAVRPATPVPGR